MMLATTAGIFLFIVSNTLHLRSVPNMTNYTKITLLFASLMFIFTSVPFAVSCMLSNYSLLFLFGYGFLVAAILFNLLIIYHLSVGSDILLGFFDIDFLIAIGKIGYGVWIADDYEPKLLYLSEPFQKSAQIQTEKINDLGIGLLVVKGLNQSFSESASIVPIRVSNREYLVISTYLRVYSEGVRDSRMENHAFMVFTLFLPEILHYTINLSKNALKVSYMVSKKINRVEDLTDAGKSFIIARKHCSRNLGFWHTCDIAREKEKHLSPRGNRCQVNSWFSIHFILLQ